MTWNQPYITDVWTTYSYKPYAAVAAVHADVDEGRLEMKVYLPQADFFARAP